VPGADSPTTSFNGHLLIKEGSLQLGSDGFSLIGRKTALTRIQIENPKCLNTYQTQEQVWDGYEWVFKQVTKHRKWNALKLTQVPSSTFLSCAKGSILEIFDNKSGFVTSIYNQTGPKVPSWVVANEGGLNATECLVDALE
jgi:hypothetical protein